MSNFVQIEIDVIYNEIPSIIAQIDEIAEASEWNAAQFIEARAKKNAPVSVDGNHGNPPGYMRDSIETGHDEIGWYVKVGAFYGAYVEFGTVRMAAIPFLTPAVEDAREYFKQDLSSRLSKLKGGI